MSCESFASVCGGPGAQSIWSGLLVLPILKVSKVSPQKLAPLPHCDKVAPRVRLLHTHLNFFYTEGLETQDFKVLFTNTFDRVLTKVLKDGNDLYMLSMEVWACQRQLLTLWHILKLRKHIQCHINVRETNFDLKSVASFETSIYNFGGTVAMS